MERTGLSFLILCACSVVLLLEGVSAFKLGDNARCTLGNTSFALLAKPGFQSIIAFDTNRIYHNLTDDDNITCHWKITAPPGYFVKIKFAQFKGCNELYNCSYYYFEAREGRNESGPLLSKLCTSDQCLDADKIYSIGTDMFVKFYFKKTPINFHVTFLAGVYAVRHDSFCTADFTDDGNHNIIFKESQGMFNTPYSSLHHGYPRFTDCTWKIVAPPGYIVKVEFSSFSLIKVPDCELDFVELSDGAFHSGINLGKYCGTIASARTIYSITSGLTVHFVATAYYSKDPRDGFVARYQILKQKSSGPCTDSNPSNEMSGQGGTLLSPNYPFNYPSNKRCTWVITPLKGQHLQFSTLGFHLKPSTSYSCQDTDHLEVRRGTTAAGTLVGSFCGVNGPIVIYASDSLWVQFVSKQNSYKGFSASYESIANIPRICSPLNNASTNNDLQLSDHRGFLRSPYYPGNYPNKLQCTWKIKGLPGKRIKLTLNDIDLGPPSDTCQSDYLQIRNGMSGSSSLQGNYCKAKTNQVIYSEGNSMWIRFHSDSKATFKGFDASYEINELCDNFNSFDANNNIRLSGSSGNFSSPGYPSNYPKDLYCTWKITVPEGKVKLTFSHFDVTKKSSTCGSDDFVQVYNGIGTHDTIGIYCGENIPGPIYSKDNTMSVYFRTRTGVASGFKAQFSTAAQPTRLAIIGGVVGGVILLTIIGSLVFVFVVRKRRQGSVQHIRMH
ncbi:tolloid-like protein 2 [Actinia tenebrosa]|uniref:Tolloid-like protein 2 n=1 Tax=Actinia tenebrosa TaxID=6105 RepID=A0A6P8IBI4_ACTTE|nr:tolloid-like protein 2 [Actinia tenebrosa]